MFGMNNLLPANNMRGRVHSSSRGGTGSCIVALKAYPCLVRRSDLIAEKIAGPILINLSTSRPHKATFELARPWANQMGSSKSTLSNLADAITSLAGPQDPLPDLPPEIWVLIFRFLRNHNLGRMALVSKEWREISWTFATALDTSFITSQPEFEQIMLQLEKSAQNPRSPGALRTLRLVPKRVKGHNATNVFQRVNFLTSLRSLDLSQCREIPWHVVLSADAVVPLLTELSLRACSTLVDPIAHNTLPPLFNSLARLKSLKLLDLGRCKVSMEAFPLIREGLPKLEQLLLRDAEIKYNITNEPEKSPMFHLAKMPNLQKLDMSRMLVPAAFLSGANLRLLSESTSLRNLKLFSGSWSVSFQDLPYPPNLTSLKAGIIMNVDGRAETALATAAISLRKLHISLSYLEKEVSIATVLTSLTNLTKLNLARCALTGMTALTELRNLHSLSIYSCEPVEGYDFLSSIENLTCLDLLGGPGDDGAVPNLNQEGFLKMVESIGKLPNLVKLRIPIAQAGNFTAFTTLTNLQRLRLRSVGYAYNRPSYDPIYMLVCDKMKRVLPFWARNLSHLRVDHAICASSLEALCSRLPGLYKLCIHIGEGENVSLVPTLQLTALQMLKVEVHRPIANPWYPDIVHPTAEIKRNS